MTYTIRNIIIRMMKPGFLFKGIFKVTSFFKKKYNKTSHGSGYGGWTICPDGLSQDSVIYSFGVGEDASFDLSIIEAYGAEVFAFDPTPRSKTWVESNSWPQEFRYYPLGIASQSGKMVFHPPENPLHVSYTLLSRPDRGEEAITADVRRLSELVKLSGHTEIDILKMDIEGAEYDVIPDILMQKQIKIDQILVEFHDHFPDISWQRTRRAIRQMKKEGYRLFNISPNGNEYSFLLNE